MILRSLLLLLQKVISETTKTNEILANIQISRKVSVCEIVEVPRPRVGVSQLGLDWQMDQSAGDCLTPSLTLTHDVTRGGQSLSIADGPLTMLDWASQGSSIESEQHFVYSDGSFKVFRTKSQQCPCRLSLNIGQFGCLSLSNIDSLPLTTRSVAGICTLPHKGKMRVKKD